MSTTQAKTQVLGKEKRGSTPSVRPQLRNVTKSTNASKPVISTANSRIPKPTTTISPKPTNATSTIKSTKRTLSSSTTTTTARNVEKPPTLNRRGSSNNAPSSVRVQRSSTATTVGEKLVQPKSAASSLKTVAKSVPKSQRSDLIGSRPLSDKRKPKDDNAMKPPELETEPDRISSDDQEVSVPLDKAKEFVVNVIEDTSNIDETKDDYCSDKTRDEIESELDETDVHTDIEHERDETEIQIEIIEEQINIEKDVNENELKKGENNPTGTTIESKDQPEEKQQEKEESFLKASEIRKRMEAQAGSQEAAAVTPWKVVQVGRPFVRREVAAPVSNEVIEETTSKLIKENRRNKVLAMVGAFETVISNQ